jgi:hypothetical protein
MNIATGSMKIKCNQCGETHVIPSEDADFGAKYGHERQMGQENGYVWNHSIACECGNSININCEVWEYPEGALNNDNTTIQGGVLIVGFGYNFHSPD